MTLVGLEPEALLMVFMRVSGFVFAAPVFGSRLVPAPVKVWFSVILAFALVPVLGLEGGLPSFASPAYFILAAREVLLGLMIGFISTFFVHGVEFAGHMLGLQMGFAASTLFDPFSNNEVSVVGSFQGLLAIVLFLGMNGHHVLLSSFAASYRILAPSANALAAAGGKELIYATANIFTVAVRISIPVLSALFMVEVGLALLAKTVPQMNIFVVGFPLKIAVGLTVLGFSIPYFAYILAKAVMGNNADLGSVLGALAGG
jgi:flagellar biosynthetic protein FliR